MSSNPIQFAISVALLSVAATACLGGGDHGPECRQGDGLRAHGLSGQSLNSNQLALSFYGQADTTSADIATYLEIQGIRAAFFIHGDSARDAKGILARLKASGQLVGSGLYSSQKLSTVENVILSATRTDQILTPYVTGNIFLMRFPDGIADSSTASILNREGMAKYAGPITSDIGGPSSNAAGNFSADNCTEGNPSSCTQDLLTASRRQLKGIIALPLGRPSMAAVLREFVSTIKTEGFEFRNFDEVPDIRYSIQQSGGTPGAPVGTRSCNDY